MTDAPKRYRKKGVFEVTIDNDGRYIVSDAPNFKFDKRTFERIYEPVKPRSIIGESFTVVNNSSTAKAIISGTEVRIEDEEPVEESLDDEWISVDDEVPKSLDLVIVDHPCGVGYRLVRNFTAWYALDGFIEHSEIEVKRWKRPPKDKNKIVDVVKKHDEQAAQGWSVDELAIMLCDIDGHNPYDKESGNYTIPYDADYIGEDNIACDGRRYSHNEPWVYYYRLYGEKAAKLMEKLGGRHLPKPPAREGALLEPSESDIKKHEERLAHILAQAAEPRD